MRKLNFRIYLLGPSPYFQQHLPEFLLISHQYTLLAPEIKCVELPEHAVPFGTSVPLHSHHPPTAVKYIWKTSFTLQSPRKISAFCRCLPLTLLDNVSEIL